ncbi:MAG: type II secretion system protein GspL [Gammaproteobacteria bacterium]|nr:type II secretion system protein GspL [Gammaproteobacteria bacterium]
MLRLFVRFTSPVDGMQEALLDWLIRDDADGVQAEGRTDRAGLATLVADDAPWATDPARVVAFVPTAEVVALRCEVPGRTAAQLRRAARYAVEPFVTEDIDTMHVACGALARHEPVRCLVTPHAAMWAWLDVLGEAGIAPGCMTPEAMALPTDANTIAVLYDGDDALVRAGDQLASIDAANLAAALTSLRTDLDDADGVMLRQINGSLSAVDLRAAGFAIDEVEKVGSHGSVLADLASAFDARLAIDLLQGEFTVKRRAGGAWARWRPAAVLAGAWLVLGLLIAAAQGFWANHRADGYRAEAVALYRDIYGVDRAPGNPATRMRVRLGQAPETRLGFHRLLGHLGVALSDLSGKYELRSVSYNERSGFGADVLVADYDVLDELKAALGERGVDLEIVSAEQHEDRARASIRIADHWIGPGWAGNRRG